MQMILHFLLQHFLFLNMLNICYQFAEAYGVMFNSSKSKLFCFGWSDSRSCVHVPHVGFSGSIIELVKHDKHLGNVTGQNCSMYQIQDCFSAFNDKVNLIISDTLTLIVYINYLKHTACHCMVPSFGIMIIELSTPSMLHGERLFAGYSTCQHFVIYYHIFVKINHQTSNYIRALSLLLIAYQNLPMLSHLFFID